MIFVIIAKSFSFSSDKFSDDFATMQIRAEPGRGEDIVNNAAEHARFVILREHADPTDAFGRSSAADTPHTHLYRSPDAAETIRYT